VIACACCATTRSTFVIPSELLPRRLRLVAFDLDNTLYDETTYFAAAFEVIAPRVATWCGMPAARVAGRLHALLAEKGKHYHHLFTDVLGEVGLPERGHLDEVLALFRGVRPALRPFPGVDALLADLGRVYRLGLITSGMRAVQENKVDLLGIAPHFASIVYSSTLRENKPSPMPFQHLLDALGVEPGEAVYVGDNPLQDFRGPNQIGMATVRIRNPEFDGMIVAPDADGRIRLETVAELRGLLL
jgi:putative hydrolase of the HAD superfamily